MSLEKNTYKPDSYSPIGGSSSIKLSIGKAYTWHGSSNRENLLRNEGRYELSKVEEAYVKKMVSRANLSSPEKTSGLQRSLPPEEAQRP